MSEIENITGSTFSMKSVRIKSMQPQSFRLLKKKDGSLVLQAAFFWTEGSGGGIDWEDIPTVIEGEE